MADENGAGPDTGVFDTGDPDADKYLYAHEMWARENRSMGYIAEYFKIGRTTAHRWVHKGEELASQLPMLDALRGRRNEIEFMRYIKEWMGELRRDLDPVDQVKAADVAIKASARAAALGGYDAPTRTDNTIRTGDGRGPVVDGSVVRGVDRALEQYQRGGNPRDDNPPGAGEGRTW